MRDGKCVMAQPQSQMWAVSLGVRYRSSLVLISGNDQYEAIAPLSLLLSGLPSSEMGDHDTEVMAVCGCVRMYRYSVWGVHVCVRLLGAEASRSRLCMLFVQAAMHACIHICVEGWFIVCECSLQQLTGPVILTGRRQFP